MELFHVVFAALTITQALADLPPNCPIDVCKGEVDGSYKNPSEYDQSYYYTCTSGMTKCSKCPPGLVFNDAKKECDNASLSTASTTQSTTPHSTTHKPSTQPPSTTTGTTSYCPIDVCKGEVDGDYKNPSEYDQHFYYTCTSGITKCRECPGDLVFNDAKKVCDYAVLSTASTTQKGTTQKSTTQRSTMPHSTTRKPSTKPPSTTRRTTSPPSTYCPSDGCAERPDGNYANPHPYEQKHFIRCRSGKLSCWACNKGKVFDGTLKKCKKVDDSHDKPCPKGPIVSVTTTKTTTTTTLVTTTNYLPSRCSNNSHTQNASESP